jgi:hypothetical protein
MTSAWIPRNPLYNDTHPTNKSFPLPFFADLKKAQTEPLYQGIYRYVKLDIAEFVFIFLYETI